VHPARVVRNVGARPGDALILTKPLGSGLIINGLRKGLLDDDRARPVLAMLARLNREAAAAMVRIGVHAATDVTGFGLFGHAHEMADRSGVRIRIDAGSMPAMGDALEIARRGVRTGGDPRNREFAGPHVDSDGLPDDLAALGYDAQTAGGLLISLPADKSLSLEAEFRARDLFLRRIGGVEEGAGVVVS
jgi:selenide,water dikinase